MPPPGIETDLARIDALARERWADNWNFRAFLQQQADPRTLDRTVHALHAEVAAAVDCTACANCCRAIHPYLRPADVSRLSRGLGLTNAAFRDRYVRSNENGEQVFNAEPCPMLAGDGRCTVYASRPGDCREYPHLHKPHFLERSVGVIESYRVCPIVFNVYERLKTATRYDPSVDWIGDEPVEE